MKKTKKILIGILILIIFLFPIKRVYKDGGTITYTALSYKIIIWANLEFDDECESIKRNNKQNRKVDLYFFPFNFKSLDSYPRK